MSNNITNETLDYFQQYRNLIKIHSDTIMHIQKLGSEMESLKQSSKNMLNEINAMKRIMTYMIDNGMDPVEAKLKIDGDNNISYWDEITAYEREELQHLKRMYMGTMMGATGAIGLGGVDLSYYSSANRGTENIIKK